MKNEVLFYKQGCILGQLLITYLKLKKYFYWPSILKEVMQWLESVILVPNVKNEYCAYPGYSSLERNIHGFY